MSADSSTTTTTATATVAVARADALAPAQHKAGLWADAAQQVYAVVMGQRVAGLAARLATADIADHDCLLPGALTPLEQAQAPYLVALKPGSAFTDWLLFDAARDFPDWGVLVRSPARLMVLRNHLRSLLQAVLPGGQRITLDWMDPPILEAVLPGFGTAQLTGFFGPARSFTVAGTTAWRHAEAPMGRLARREVPLARTGD